ncbi:hisC, partial [Symbiodinium pilosum]
VKDPDFGARLAEVRGRAPATIFAIDETYMGFTEGSEDDQLLLSLAEEYDNVVLIRSLSKVEGLAAVRLGWAQSTPNTVRAISEGLPFAGQLYISELALAGALAALRGPAAPEHRRQVRKFYEEEQQWLREQLEEIGFETFASQAPFFVLRGPADALQAAVKAGAAVQRFDFPGDQGSERRSAVCLVADRASNETTLRCLVPEKEEDPLAWAAGM